MPENMQRDSSSYIPGEKRKGDSVSFTNHQANPQFISWDIGEKYSVQRILGKGSYGQVALAIDRFVDVTLYRSFYWSPLHNTSSLNPIYFIIVRTNDEKVAIKRMTNIFDDQTDAKRAYREMHILR